MCSRCVGADLSADATQCPAPPKSFDDRKENDAVPTIQQLVR
ncbi:MAG: hypothetical protein QOK30_3181, partial [Nocardioidaceae bacterium]|nr:hypothetical protein [Nocardioidaceae bacterium]